MTDLLANTLGVEGGLVMLLGGHGFQIRCLERWTDESLMIINFQ